MDGQDMLYDALRYSADREAATARATIKRLHTVIVVLIIVIAFIVGAGVYAFARNEQKWRDYLSEYDFESYEVISNDGGDANFIGQNGDINYGVYKSSPQSEESVGE